MFDYQASIYQHTLQNHICLFERVMVGEQRGVYNLFGWDKILNELRSQMSMVIS